jgi:hypothetical protein
MSAGSLAKKLQIKPGQRIVVVNAPPGYAGQLGPLPAGALLATRLTGMFDAVHLFVKSVAELNRLAPKAIRALRQDGLLWIAYPKGASGIKTDINRDIGWEVVHDMGLRPVTQVAIDGTWSALRFRRGELVGK